MEDLADNKRVVILCQGNTQKQITKTKIANRQPETLRTLTLKPVNGYK